MWRNVIHIVTMERKLSLNASARISDNSPPKGETDILAVSENQIMRVRSVVLKVE